MPSSLAMEFGADAPAGSLAREGEVSSGGFVAQGISSPLSLLLLPPPPRLALSPPSPSPVPSSSTLPLCPPPPLSSFLPPLLTSHVSNPFPIPSSPLLLFQISSHLPFHLSSAFQLHFVFLPIPPLSFLFLSSATFFPFLSILS